jgi:copper transport protein
VSARARIGAVLAAALSSLLLPALALAHATLEETEPARGATVESQPERIVFNFSEQVELNFSAIHVYDATGKTVDDGKAGYLDGNRSAVVIGLQPDRPDGTYTATFRVISADGHPVSGGFVFSIGEAGAAPVKSVAELAGGAAVGKGTTVTFGVARAVQYGAIALAIGAIAFLLLPWVGGLRAVAGAAAEWQAASEAFLARTRALLLVAVAGGVASGVAGIVLQGQTAIGGNVLDALDPAVVRGVLETHFGFVWGARILVWVALGAATVLAFRRAELPAMRPATLSAAGLALARPLGGRHLTAMLVLLALLGISPSLAGHANAQSPTAVLLPSNAAHVFAISVWLGGLVMLLVALPGATRRLALPDRGRLLAAVLSRFSTMAGACVAVVVVSGVVQSFVYVRNLDNLLHTEYGKILIAKLCLFAVVLAFGGYNRQFSVPRLNRIAEGGESPGRAGVLLRRALRAEVVLLVAVLGVTGAIAGFAPATAVEAATAGPFAKTDTIGPAQIQLTVDPARVGPNLMHLYLLEPRTGAQWDRAEEVRITLVHTGKGIELPVTARKGGPGHFIVDGGVFSSPGTWEVRIAARVSEFDEYAKTIEVPIG